VYDVFQKENEEKTQTSYAPCGNAVIDAHMENLMDSTMTRLNISRFISSADQVLPTGLPQSLGKV
jgi:hypothetical protein